MDADLVKQTVSFTVWPEELGAKKGSSPVGAKFQRIRWDIADGSCKIVGAYLVDSGDPRIFFLGPFFLGKRFEGLEME